jgi:ABC-type glycerol-3-phosphate transport system permease component
MTTLAKAGLRGTRARPALGKRTPLARIGLYGTLAVVTLVFGYPLLWMLFGAGKTMQTFFYHLWWVASPYHWSNFIDVWTKGHVGRYLLNSALVTIASIALNLVLVYPLSYAVARMRFLGHKAVLGIFAICLFVPVQLMVIPLFSLENGFHILDSYWALILPYTAMTMPFSVVFVTSFLRTIPQEIEEAATIDGCSRLRIMVRIMMPL